MFRVEKYRRANGQCPFDDFMEEASESGKKEAAKIQRSIDNLKERGLVLLATSAVKKIEDDLYELRRGPYRVFVCWSEAHQAFFLLNGFRKRSRKLPTAELAEARRLCREFLGEAR